MTRSNTAFRVFDNSVDSAGTTTTNGTPLEKISAPMRLAMAASRQSLERRLPRFGGGNLDDAQPQQRIACHQLTRLDDERFGAPWVSLDHRPDRRLNGSSIESQHPHGWSGLLEPGTIVNVGIVKAGAGFGG